MLLLLVLTSFATAFALNIRNLPQCTSFPKPGDKPSSGGLSDVDCDESAYFRALDALAEEIEKPNVAGAQRQLVAGENIWFYLTKKNRCLVVPVFIPLPFESEPPRILEDKACQSKRPCPTHLPKCD